MKLMRNQPISSLESVWAQREEDVYPRLFGSTSRGIFPLSLEVFTEVFGQSDVDPRWLHFGIFEYAPTPRRQSWLYATSGASNPWELDPSEYATSEFSGFGTELVLEVPYQANWAILALQRLLAYNILLVHGRFGEVPPLNIGARVPLGGPFNGDKASSIRYIALGTASHYNSSFKLASGVVNLLHVVGITESERDYAKIHGTAALLKLLEQSDAFPVTDPMRRSVF